MTYTYTSIAHIYIQKQLTIRNNTRSATNSNRHWHLEERPDLRWHAETLCPGASPGGLVKTAKIWMGRWKNMLDLNMIS